jgi:polyhydroxyalkanoate synthesis regulator phasin
MAATRKHSKKSPDTARAEQSVQAFRDAIEKSITISRERLQEVVDDAVRRGRMTQADAEELVGRVVTRGRGQAEEILAQLERLLDQVRDIGGVADRAREQADRARGQVGNRAKKAQRRAVGAVDKPLERADRMRRKARVPGFPITAYDQLTARQIDRRLAGLTRKDLRKVRDYERRNKARKGLLRSLDRKLQA